MLKNQTLLALLRQTPLRAGILPASPSSSRALVRTPQRVPKHHFQQQKFISTRTARSGKLAPLSRWRPSFIRQTPNSRWNSNKPAQTAIEQNGSQTPQSLSARFKELSRKYGYAAVGVYLGLSVLDFPFCFLAVRLIGPERIGEIEHAIIDAFWSFISIAVPSMEPEDRTQKEAVTQADAQETQSVDKDGNKHNGTASIWTQLILAYGVHKSLIFFRVPLTAAVTPKVVKTLRGWGWNIGRPAKKAKSASPQA